MYCSMTEHSRIMGRPVRAAWLAAIVLLAAGLLAAVALPARAEDAPADDEVTLGKQAAEQIAKESKFVTDPALVQRVEAIGNAIAKVANEKELPASYGKSKITQFAYSFKIVDDKSVNAFALPGGFIYVNKGLIDFVHSDDELAGVMAHEVAHSAHHHYMALLKAQQKEMLKQAIALIAGAALGGKSGDLDRLALIVNMVTIAKLSSYGREAEEDADRTAVGYLAETKYNPVGMLTFMERLAREESLKPQIDPGIWATHPPTHLRAHEIIGELNKRKIPVNRRLVTKYMQVEVKPVEKSQAFSVWITGTEVIRLADSGGQKAAARAEHVAEKLSNTLLAGARIHNVKLGAGGRDVIVKGELIVSPTKEDASLAGSSVNQVAANAAGAIRTALAKESLGQPD